MLRLLFQMPSSYTHFAFITFMQIEDKWRAFEMTCEICNYGNRWAQRGQKWGQTRNCKNDLFFLNEYWLLKKGLIFFKGIGYGSLETHAICLLPMLDSANLLWKLFCMEVLHCIDCRTFVLIWLLRMRWASSIDCDGLLPQVKTRKQFNAKRVNCQILLRCHFSDA